MRSIIFQLAFKSMRRRKSTILLGVVSVTIAITLILGLARFQKAAQDSFFNTISQADLIVGTRTGSINLLLSTLFQIGSVPAGVKHESYEKIRKLPNVAWSIPLSYGDSHKGYRVLATDENFFLHYKYGDKKNMELAQGRQFETDHEVVIGDNVAQKLGYTLGAAIKLKHGLSEDGIFDHEADSFTVSGILKETGTVIDKTVLVSLEGFEQIHAGWVNGVPSPSNNLDDDHSDELDSHADEGKHTEPEKPADEGKHTESESHTDEGKHTEPENHADENIHDEHENDSGEPAHIGFEPAHSDEHDHDDKIGGELEINAFIIGLKNRSGLFEMIRHIKDFPAEPLQAIVPGLVLFEIWAVVGVAERAFLILSFIIFIGGLFGMMSTILTSLSSRGREMAILRSVGAKPEQIYGLMTIESMFIVLMSMISSITLINIIQLVVNTVFFKYVGFTVPLSLPQGNEWYLLLVVLGLSLVFSSIPAFKAYKMSLISSLETNS